MSVQREFYLERAAEARAGALAATLHNVRDRWLRAEASWTEMAARSRRGEQMRDKLIADKARARAEAAAAEAAAPLPAPFAGE
jgi:hypothetical protein